ncbi:MAG: PrsW family intramembrane metalloprotease [Parcubacteria group bacterium]|nr:PrsW family intramembrane metalloprotease [Parcubacteria group bacterium]
MATHHHISIEKTSTVGFVLFAVTVLAMQYPEDSGRVASALLGGILPALLWLWFWLKEDKAHPEPKRIIFTAFFIGMLGVPIAIFFEKMAMDKIGAITFTLFLSWAIIEEVVKYAAASMSGFRSKYFDEPIDAIMYLISASLGFAALENVLFIFSAIADDGFAGALVTGQLRFVGASLLHVASSALIGFSVAFGLCETRFKRGLYLCVGLLTGISLHTAFNYLIMITNGEYLLSIFGLLWLVIVLIILLFEKIKRSQCAVPPEFN